MKKYFQRNREWFIKRNGVPLCIYCHSRLENSHDTFEINDMTNKIIRTRGQSWTAYIREQKGIKVRVRQWWLKEQIERLERYLGEFNAS